MTDRLEEAMGELGAALVQALHSDDQIIMGHVERAHALIREEWIERRAARQSNCDVAAAVRVQGDFNRLMKGVFGV